MLAFKEKETKLEKAYLLSVWIFLVVWRILFLLSVF